MSRLKVYNMILLFKYKIFVTIQQIKISIIIYGYLCVCVYGENIPPFFENLNILLNCTV